MRQPNRRKFLFDQNADPHELTNLVDSPDHIAIMDAFDAEITAHMAATGDDWDMHSSFPPPNFLTHEEAKAHLRDDLLPKAIEVA